MERHKSMKNICYKFGQNVELPPDKALLMVQADSTESVSLYTQSAECYKCPMVPVCSTGAGESSMLVVTNSSFGTRWDLRLPSGDLICNGSTHFGEHGIYNLTAHLDGKKCEIIVDKQPVNSFMPILYAFLVYLGIGTIWFTGTWLHRKWKSRRTNYDLQEDENSHADAPGTAKSTESPIGQSGQPKKKSRLRSLDTFRGISIVVMIFVNYGGGGYWFFNHSAWNGLTVADLVFPWFMFIMGTSLALSFNASMRREVPRWELWRRVLVRSLKLFALGLVLNTEGCESADVYHIRIPGVLQRFGLAYFVVGSLRCLTVERSLFSQISAKFPLFQDVLRYLHEWCLMMAVLTLHLLVTFLLPVPGCPKGYLGAGGLFENQSHPNCTGGAAGFVDLKIFGANHIYGHPTSKDLYNNPGPYDPEGGLGCLTSIFIVYLGLHAGQILLTYGSHVDRLVRWILMGSITGLIAGLLCSFSQNEGVIPVNKNLWSVSFILCMACFAYFLLSVLYVIQDVCKVWDGSPLYQAGMNAILLYCGHEVFHEYFPITWAPLPNTHGARLAQDLWGASFWVIVALVFDFNGFYFSV